jgi:hypothetical protein
MASRRPASSTENSSGDRQAKGPAARGGEDNDALDRTIAQLRAAALALEQPEVRRAMAVVAQAAHGLTVIQARIASVGAQGPAAILAARSANAGPVPAPPAMTDPRKFFPQLGPNATIYDALGALAGAATPQPTAEGGEQPGLRRLVAEEVARALNRPPRKKR